MLSVFNTVLQGHEERITKYLTRILKTDAVLALVRGIFLLVSFEPDVRHAIIVVISSQLRKATPELRVLFGWSQVAPA